MVIFSWISDLMGSFPVILILWFYYCWSKIFFLGIFKLNNCLQTTCSSRSVVILLLTSMTMLITIGKTPPRLLVLVQLLTTTSWKKREDILFYSCGKENQKETKKKKIPFFSSPFSFVNNFSTLSCIFSFFQMLLSLMSIYKSFLSSPLFLSLRCYSLPVARISRIDLQVSAAQCPCQLAPKQYSQSSQSLNS